MGVTILRDAQELLTKEKLENYISTKLLDIGGDLRSSISQISESFTCNYVAINNNDQKNSIMFDLNDDSLYDFLIRESFDTIVFINVLEHLENPVFVINDLFKGALATKTNKILISTPFLFKHHPSPKDYYRLSSEWYIKKFNENIISQSYEIEVLGIGGGIFKYLFSFFYENFKIKRYFRKFCLPLIRFFLNDELKKKLTFPIGYYITITRRI